MPHSPITRTIHEPIKNLDSKDRQIRNFRDRLEEELFETDWVQVAEELLDTGDSLVNQCRFLEDKLKIRNKKIQTLEPKIQVFEKQAREMEEKLKLQQDKLHILLDAVGNCTCNEEVLRMRTGATNGDLNATAQTKDGKGFPGAEEPAVPKKRARINN